MAILLSYVFRYRSEKEKNRLKEAGVGEEVVNAAISEFIHGFQISQFFPWKPFPNFSLFAHDMKIDEIRRKSGNHRASRKAGRASVQQRSVYAEIDQISDRIVSERAVHFDVAGREGDRAFHHFPPGHHFRFRHYKLQRCYHESTRNNIPVVSGFEILGSYCLNWPITILEYVMWYSMLYCDSEIHYTS